MRTAILKTIAALLVALPAAAITPYRVADIDPVPQELGSFPGGFSALGNRAIFATASTGEIWSTDGTTGGTIRLAEGLGARVVANSGPIAYFAAVVRDPDGALLGRLWATDGTAAGTTLLVGDVPQTAFGLDFAAVPGTRRMFFTFDDSIHGHELWTSDGTVAGTRLVLDLWPGAADGLRSFIHQVTVFHGKAYFSGDDGGGPALWVSDGTAAGTARIFSFGTADEAFGPFAFAPLAGRLLFFAQTAASGIEPWATDGTAGGTVQLAEIGAGAGSITNLSEVHSTGSLAYFAVGADPEGVELWRTDGTPGGTFPLTDFPGAEPFGRFSQLTIATVGQSVAFAADDGVHGVEPWASDGTIAGTRLIKDICPGSCDGSFDGYMARGSTLYFVATTQDFSSRDLEPWISNLTAAGTRRLKDLCAGPCSSVPEGFVAAGGFVYLTAMDRNLAHHLWRTDGSTAGTVRVADGTSEPPGTPPQGSLEAVAFRNTLLFSWSDPEHGWEPWRSDGTRAGTRRIADLEHLDQGGSMPFDFMKAGNQSFFFADDGTHSFELWTSDGTAAGTRLVRDLEPGPGPTTVPYIGPWAEANGRLVFVRSFFSVDPELWGSDGTAAGTVRLLDPGTTVDPFLRAVGSKVYFLARDAAHGLEPWVTDGTKSGTRLLRDIEPGPGPVGRDAEFSLVAFKGRLLFRGGDSFEPDLWLSDGTTAGTVPLANVYPFLVEPLAELSGDPVELGGKVYFDRSHDGFGSTLWVTDLTAAGTLPRGPVSDEPGFRTFRLFAAGQKIFVYGYSDHGYGLWATDGRPGGGRLLGRFYLEFTTNLTLVPVAFSGKLFFRTSGSSPNPDFSEAELWASDGTVAGTRRVQSPSGVPILNPRALVPFADQLICSAAQTGFWRTNGTPAGTAPLLARSPVVDPRDLIVAGSRLYFANMDAETGTELWALRP